MRGVCKGILLYGLILLAIAIVGMVFLFTPEPPQITGSILDSLTLENGTFSLDGLTREMTETDVAASLDARELIYTSSRDAEVIWIQNIQNSWISLADATRIDELGKVTMRRTYYFENDALTSVALEGKASKKQAGETAECFERLRETLDTALIPHSKEYGVALKAGGNRAYMWQGEDGSSLYLSGTMTSDGELEILIRITV